ncbi:MAG: penicillin acylase family protein [Chitinophagaceae bacterium]|nr:penicillin acylase family protein [Chitinophagaceae bacterium]
MKKLLLFFFLGFPAFLFAQEFAPQEINQWKQQAAHVTIIRDNYGIPHVYGDSDADAVFGLIYAQCEDDFPRVEMNYIDKLGRLSEIFGEEKVYDDLLTKLVIDSAGAIRDYHNAPVWLKKLCDAWAAGINYFLYRHPEVKPRLIHKFQSWYPMLWTDGSIGAISTADMGPEDLKQFYENRNESDISSNLSVQKSNYEEKVTGSNGFAFSPKITKSKNAILYINPHVTFYFRPEVHMVSKEGLNAYGAVTWGQFFVYQGFNEHLGWMHTSSYTDVSDAYIEKILKNGNQYFTLYDGKPVPVKQKEITINYKQGSKIIPKTFTTYFTNHGPVLGIRNGSWIAVKSDNRDIKGLIQSWERTKAKSFSEYKKVMDLLANASNNTVYADDEGNIAYWHGNFIPKRDPSYDWSKPVDGSTSKTQWQGLIPVEQSIHVYNPPNGWLENCNSTPFTVAGSYSPKKEDYPTYMAPDGQNFRGLNAIRILPEEKNYTLEKVIETGYNTYLTGFAMLIPPLIKAYHSLPENDSLKSNLKDAIDTLSKWDFHCSENSVATTLAVYWGERLLPHIFRMQVEEGEDNDIVGRTKTFVDLASPSDFLLPLEFVLRELTSKFGAWNIRWGNINRFQRISGDIENHFDDSQPSYSVPFVSSTWGMIPSYSSRSFPGTVKRYGINGNSFVCAVEFGKRVKAKSLLAGGESGHPDSPHFFDQGEMYTEGKFKDVLFYKADVLKHAEKTYHPGEERKYFSPFRKG